MKNIIPADLSSNARSTLEALADACYKERGFATRYEILDERFGLYTGFKNSLLFTILTLALPCCFIISLFATLVNVNKTVLTIIPAAFVIASAVGMFYFLWKKQSLYSQVDWEQLNFFQDTRKLLEELYDIDFFSDIQSAIDLQEFVEADVLEITRKIKKENIHNPDSAEKTRQKNLVSLIVRLGWSNTEYCKVSAKTWPAIWRERANWLYKELFK